MIRRFYRIWKLNITHSTSYNHCYKETIILQSIKPTRLHTLFTAASHTEFLKHYLSINLISVYCTWIYGQPDYHHILGQALVLVPTIGTYVECHYIDTFNLNKCQHFEGTGCTLWNFLVPSNVLKVFPSVPCEQS